MYVFTSRCDSCGMLRRNNGLCSGICWSDWSVINYPELILCISLVYFLSSLLKMHGPKNKIDIHLFVDSGYVIPRIRVLTACCSLCSTRQVTYFNSVFFLSHISLSFQRKIKIIFSFPPKLSCVSFKLVSESSSLL